MTRRAIRRTTPIQTEKPLPPAPTASVPRSEEPPALEPVTGRTWNWRLVMFIWTTSFVLLFLYELLSALLRSK
jgi:hypothetical protein